MRRSRGTRIRVSVTIARSKAAVWEEVRQIDRHVLWMKDARSIEFETDQREGVGVSFVCKTQIGPLRTTDRMEITEWAEGRTIGVRHVGLVTGSGRFELRGEMGLNAVFRWEERLEFPWWMLGSLGGRIARPVLKHVWQRNLNRLKALIEAETSSPV